MTPTPGSRYHYLFSSTEMPGSVELNTGLLILNHRWCEISFFDTVSPCFGWVSSINWWIISLSAYFWIEKFTFSVRSQQLIEKWYNIFLSTPFLLIWAEIEEYSTDYFHAGFLFSSPNGISKLSHDNFYE